VKQTWTALSLIALLIANPCAAEERIRFHGNRDFSSSELADFLGFTSKREFLPDSIDVHLDRLVDSLVMRDYLFARIDSFKSALNHRDQAELHVFLDEGDLSGISAVRWLGDSLRVPAAAAQRSLCRTGRRFHWKNIEYDANLVLDALEQTGYPFAKVDVEWLPDDSVQRGVQVRLLISSGPLTTIESVTFPGNKHTQTAFLVQETRLRLGERYNTRRIEAARRRLARLDFIRRVGKTGVSLDNSGRTGIAIPVEESRATRLDVVAGYLPETEGRKAVVSGLVNLEFLNLFGSGRRARIHWDRPDNRIQAVEISYREPWVLFLPLAIRADFGQRIEDTLYVTRKIGIRAEIDVGTRVLAWGTLQHETVITDSLAAAVLGLPNLRTTYMESGFSFDTRDHPTNPRAGVLFSTFAGTGWRYRDQLASGEQSGSFRHHRGGMDSEIAQEIFPYWIADLGLHARILETTEPYVLLPDLFRLGGARTLRGYREEQLLGSRIGWASAEIRYWLGPASRVFAFFDAGGSYREYVDGQIQQDRTIFRTGTGIGMRMETNLGVWGIDYGVGEGDRLLSGKLHVSLLSTF